MFKLRLGFRLMASIVDLFTGATSIQSKKVQCSLHHICCYFEIGFLADWTMFLVSSSIFLYSVKKKLIVTFRTKQYGQLQLHSNILLTCPQSRIYRVPIFLFVNFDHRVSFQVKRFTIFFSVEPNWTQASKNIFFFLF